MNNGLVDASDFDDERNGWPVEQVWKEMHAFAILTGFSRHSW